MGCGKMQQQYQCSNCGAQVAFGMRFCGNCGLQLNWPAQQTQPQEYYQQQTQQPVQMHWFKRHLNWTYFLGIFAMYATFGLILLTLAIIPFSEVDENTSGTLIAVIGIMWFICVCCLKAWVIAQKGRSWAWNLMPILWLWIPLLLGNAKGK
jgi:hypothetical protein